MKKAIVFGGIMVAVISGAAVLIAKTDAKDVIARKLDRLTDEVRQLSETMKSRISKK